MEQESILGSSPHTRGARPSPGPISRRAEDHPRIRGEHTPRRLTVSMMSGSSPHTRGALLRLLHPRARRGIIPAYAGSTELDLACDAELLGSSPHTRGALHDRMGGSPWPGIIPAYAGSTMPLFALSSCDEDHPRIRGEHSRPRSVVTVVPGSSPHTRGAPSAPASSRHRSGIIPAYAGSTPSPARTATHPSDHPRIRGEHCTCPRRRAPRGGSSPHTRGAPG